MKTWRKKSEHTKSLSECVFCRCITQSNGVTLISRLLVPAPVTLLVCPASIRSPSFQRPLGPQPADRTASKCQRKERERDSPGICQLSVCACVCV